MRDTETKEMGMEMCSGAEGHAYTTILYHNTPQFYIIIYHNFIL